MDYVVHNAKRHGPPGFGLPRARDMPAMICVPSQGGLSWHSTYGLGGISQLGDSSRAPSSGRAAVKCTMYNGCVHKVLCRCAGAFLIQAQNLLGRGGQASRHHTLMGQWLVPGV
jgi:hypothetical protein